MPQRLSFGGVLTGERLFPRGCELRAGPEDLADQRGEPLVERVLERRRAKVLGERLHELDMGIALGVDPARTYTIIDFSAAARLGIRGQSSSQILNLARLAELAEPAASGDLVIPVAATYPLNDVRDAYRRLASGHPRGKIVLHP